MGNLKERLKAAGVSQLEVARRTKLHPTIVGVALDDEKVADIRAVAEQLIERAENENRKNHR